MNPRLMIALLLTAFLAGCWNQPTTNESLQHLVSGLRNSDVDWDGTPFGLMVRLKGKDAQKVLEEVDNSREAIIEALLNCLQKRDQYVIAHVLLTILEERDYSANSRYWNGLRVSLYADGTVTCGGDAQEKIMKMWKDMYPGLSQK